MSINHYFQSGIPMGRSSEQMLVENIIIECLKIYGFEVYYVPRTATGSDFVLNEETYKYSISFGLEAYMSNVMGFQGEGDLLSKFGVELRDSATFIIARQRWEDVVERTRNDFITLAERPVEGDIVYFPLTKSYFEIRKVESRNPFFQIGKMHVYELHCELMQFSSEIIDTGNPEVDAIDATRSVDILNFELTLEDGNRALLEYYNDSALVLESYLIDELKIISQNDVFTQNIDVLDFSDKNPFGEVFR